VERLSDGRRDVWAVETGVGPAASERALDWLLAQAPRPAFVLSAGFSGALRPGLRVGDLLLADRVADAGGGDWEATWPPSGAADLPRGRLLTVPSLVGDPAEKRRLGERFGADAADMETAAVARRCAAAGVPFGCLRAISDDVETPLSPALLGVLRGGRVGLLRLAGAVLRRPALVGELVRLERHTRRAAAALAGPLSGLLAARVSKRGRES
jgi:adenosylhomocysteine nucleosidase